MEEVHPINVVVMESHVFLSERHRKMLFGDTPMHINRPRPYMQGQFIYEDRVSVSTPSGTLPSVSVFGPAYPVTSVELTESDAKRLGISDVPRESGDVRFSASCILKGPFGVVDAAESVLIPKPFLCLSPEDAAWYGLRNGDTVRLCASDDPSRMLDRVCVRIHPTYHASLHLTKDRLSAAQFSPRTTVQIVQK